MSDTELQHETERLPIGQTVRWYPPATAEDEPQFYRRLVLARPWRRPGNIVKTRITGNAGGRLVVATADLREGWKDE